MASGLDLDKLSGAQPAVNPAVIDQALGDYLAGNPPAEDEITFTTLAQADWAVETIGEIEARLRDYDDRIAMWQAARYRLSAAADWLRIRVEAYGIANRTRRVKSIPLAHGTINTRRQAERVVVVDADVVLGWAKEHAPDAVRTVERFLKSEISDEWEIDDVLIGWRVTDRETGEVETIREGGGGEARRFLQADWQAMEQSLPNKRVEPITERGVVGVDGYVVPGVEVVPETVTAIVKPLLG